MKRSIGTLEGGFLANAAGKTQTLLLPVDNSESSGNSHGFTPGTNRSNATESFSIKANEKTNAGSKATNGSSFTKSKPSQSQSGSSSARSDHEALRETNEDSYVTGASKQASLHSASSSGKSGKSRHSIKNSHVELNEKEKSEGCEISSKPMLNGDVLGSCNGLAENANDSGSTHDDSAFAENNSSNVTGSTVLTNGLYPVTGDNTPEDSGTDQTKEKRKGLVLPDNQSIPNFFMPSEDMQASIKALQMATSAASKINQEDIRAENKVKAVSELVKKMANSKVKMAPTSVKNKQPPSAEEAKRIAKIFSSKFP